MRWVPQSGQISPKSPEKLAFKYSSKITKINISDFGIKEVDEPLVYGGFQGFNDCSKLPQCWV